MFILFIWFLYREQRAGACELETLFLYQEWGFPLVNLQVIWGWVLG